MVNDISNKSKQFKVFVANCVQMIQYKPKSMEICEISSNLTDSTSRSLNTVTKEKVKQSFEGPAFLRLPKDLWNHKEKLGPLEINNPEVKRNVNLFESKEKS